MDAILIGGGSTLWDDLRALGRWGDIVIGCNEAAAYPHRLDHFATLHPEKLEMWRPMREKVGGNMDFKTWTSLYKASFTDDAIGGWTSGSSGMLMVGVALRIAQEAGADLRAVLCGVPMNHDPHFFDPKPWPACMTHREAWETRLEQMQGKVWSMSGWTREVLGSPPWLDLLEQQEAA